MLSDYVLWKSEEEFTQYCSNGLIPTWAIRCFEIEISEMTGHNKEYTNEPAMNRFIKGMEYMWICFIDHLSTEIEKQEDALQNRILYEKENKKQVFEYFSIELQESLSPLITKRIEEYCEAEKMVLKHLIRDQKAFERDIYSSLYTSCLYLYYYCINDPVNNKSKKLRRLTLHPPFYLKEKQEKQRPTYSWNKICKQLIELENEEIYMLDKVTGFSTAYQGLMKSFGSEASKSALKIDGVSLIINKLSQIRYPYIRQSMFGKIYEELDKTLIGKNSTIIGLVNYYESATKNVKDINIVIEKFMHWFLDCMLGGMYRSGAFEKQDVKSRVETLLIYLRALLRDKQREKEEVLQCEGSVDATKKEKAYLDLWIASIYKQMSTRP